MGAGQCFGVIVILESQNRAILIHQCADRTGIWYSIQRLAKGGGFHIVECDFLNGFGARCRCSQHLLVEQLWWGSSWNEAVLSHHRAMTTFPRLHNCSAFSVPYQRTSMFLVISTWICLCSVRKLIFPSLLSYGRIEQWADNFVLTAENIPCTRAVFTAFKFLFTNEIIAMADTAINVCAVCLHSCQALHSVCAEWMQEGCVRYFDTGLFLESYLQILVEFISLAVFQQLIQYKLFSA